MKIENLVRLADGLVQCTKLRTSRVTGLMGRPLRPKKCLNTCAEFFWDQIEPIKFREENLLAPHFLILQNYFFNLQFYFICNLNFLLFVYFSFDKISLISWNYCKKNHRN